MTADDEAGVDDEAISRAVCRAVLGLELASPLLLALRGADESGTIVDPSPAAADGPALLLPSEVVLCAALSELGLAWRAARRFPSAAAASPSDWPKPFGARTHNKLMVYTQVV